MLPYHLGVFLCDLVWHAVTPFLKPVSIIDFFLSRFVLISSCGCSDFIIPYPIFTFLKQCILKTDKSEPDYVEIWVEEDLPTWVSLHRHFSSSKFLPETVTKSITNGMKNQFSRHTEGDTNFNTAPFLEWLGWLWWEFKKKSPSINV